MLCSSELLNWASLSRCAQSELTDPREPDAVGDVGLSPLDLLDMPRMEEHELYAGLGECIEDGFPVDPGWLPSRPPLHHGRRAN